MAQLPPPRAVWVMLPAGATTEDTVAALGELLEAGRYRDRRRQHLLPRRHPPGEGAEGQGHHYLDVGTSGGVWGLERGYCMMVGGEPAASTASSRSSRPWRRAWATFPAPSAAAGADPRAEQGYIHAGPAGAGHFVKMVHNGIEYGLMQAYAEGFDILKGQGSRMRCPRTSGSTST